MKVVFIQPSFKNIWEPLGVAYISTFIKKNYLDELDVKFYHGNFDSENDIIYNCKDADIVAFSCTTPTFKSGINLAKKIKMHNDKCKIVFGGWHPTAIGTSLELEYSDIIDNIIVGEGELPFLDLLNNIDREIYHSLEFNVLGWPDRELIKQDRTLDLCENMCGERIASFQSRRGCPMSCIFCAEKCMTGGFPIRVRDVNDLLDEIEFVDNKYKITKFKFVDPTWSFPKSAVYDFCLTKINRGIKIPFEGMIHASFIEKEMLEIAKEAGCNQLNVGVESGSQKLLNDMKKGTTIEKIKKVFAWGKEFGINMRGFFILGMPNETTESINQTRQLIKDISPDVFGMTLLTPFPGSDLYSNKYKNIDWSNCDEYSNDFYYSKNFTNQQLKDIQKSLNSEFSNILVSHQRGKVCMEKN